MKYKCFVFFLIFLVILIFVFRSLISHITVHLPDWYDYSLQVYIIFQNIAKIKSLDFAHFFDSNSFYPYPYGMLLSDLLLPQTFIALPFTYITSNIILIFNIVFILTFVLNYIALFLFWKQLFHRNLIAFLGPVFFIFSPFTQSEFGHFQILSFWPFFFTLYFVLKSEKTNKRIFLLFGGIFLALQFLASVYLGIFLIITVLLFYCIALIRTKNKKDIIIRTVILFSLFILIDGIFIKGYLDARKALNLKRDYGEFVTYSAHISDYVFTKNIQSLLHQSPLMSWWNELDNHTAGVQATGPGFTFFILSILGVVLCFKYKNKYRYLFLICMVLGFLFSLGPRYNFNGQYLTYHLPYALLLKTVFFFESVRVVARWSFFLYFGIIYFSLFAITELLKNKKIAKKAILFLSFLFIVFLIEYLPLYISSSSNKYLSEDYYELKKICSTSKKVLLEIPVTHLQTRGGIFTGLKYINDIQLASLYHGCFLINGYSGYDFPSLIQLDMQVNALYKKNSKEELMKLFRSTKADYVKINGQILKTEDIKSEIIQLK